MQSTFFFYTLSTQSTFLRQYGTRPSVILSAMLFAHHRGAEDVGVAILCNKPAVLVRLWSDGQSYNSGGRVPLAFGSMEPKCKKNSNMRPLSNGMTVTSHATDLGSIPGGRICLYYGPQAPLMLCPGHQKDARDIIMLLDWLFYVSSQYNWSPIYRVQFFSDICHGYCRKKGNRHH